MVREAESPTRARGTIIRSFFPSWDLRESVRAISPASEREEAVALHRAVAPQDADKLDRAFEDLQCLRSLWLDMEQEDNVLQLIEQVPIQLETFHEVLHKAIELESLLDFQRGFRDLKHSWLQDGNLDFVAAAEVQASGRELMMQVIETQEFSFQYKHRSHKGFALHVLALHPKGDDLLRGLLEAKADPAKFCSSCSKNKITYATAFHVAAGAGQIDSAEILLEASVDVNVVSLVEHLDDKDKGKTRRAGVGGFADVVKMVRPGASLTASGGRGGPSGSGSGIRQAHYTALHEATFFQQEQMVKFLLIQEADVNAENLSGDTALHWSARQGNVSIARLLVSASADVKLKNQDGKTALETAVESANFPGARLGMLMHRQITEIMTVAKSAPNAAKELLRDADDRCSVSPSWRPRLLDRVTVDQWVELMELAPQVAEDVLEVVTVNPAVENNDHYPLPRQASFWHSENMRVKYVKDDRWCFNATVGKGAPWHEHLIPKTRTFENMALRNMQRAVGFERKPSLVRVKMVRMPGLMNRQVLRALKDTDHLRIFTKLAAQAIIQCAWHTVVRRFYWVHLLYRTVEIGLLTAWVFLHSEDERFRKACWSWLFVCAARELFYELCEIRGYMLMRQGYFVSAYLVDAKNLFDLTSIFMLLALIVQTWWSQMLEANLPLLAAVVASRWAQLVYTFRAFPTVGQKVLPIIQSFRPLSGIFFITIFVFTGFLHAFLVLNSQVQAEEEGWLVFTSTFRFLFLGDGDAVDVILGLGGRDASTGDHVTRFFLVLGILGFSILILNLFIAGAHQAYEEAHDNAETRFFQERADICLQCLFRPTFPGQPRRWVPFAILGASIPGWLMMLMYVPSHPAIASVILFVAIVLSDSFLLQHGWHSRSRQEDMQVVPEEDADFRECTSAEAEDTDAPASTTPLSHPASTRSGKSLTALDQKYLWFCYRIECEVSGNVGEGGSSGSSLMGRKAVEKMRSSRISHDIQRLRRDTENMQYDMDLKLSHLREGMQGLGQDLSGRLDKLEQAVKGLVVNIERLGLGAQAESQQLPEGWESARAQNGRLYYFNRALKRRQWERPGSTATPSPAGGTTPRARRTISQGKSFRSMNSFCRSSTRRTNSVESEMLQSETANRAASSTYAARHSLHGDAVAGHTPALSPLAEQPGDVLSMTNGSAPSSEPGSLGASRGASAATLPSDAQQAAAELGPRPCVVVQSCGPPSAPSGPAGAASPEGKRPAESGAASPGDAPHAARGGGLEVAPLPGAADAGTPARGVATGPCGSPDRQRPEPLVDLT